MSSTANNNGRANRASLLLFATLAACTLQGCAGFGDSRANTGARGSLEASTWEASRILATPATAARSVLEFREAGAVAGTAGCNNFQGTATIDANAMSFGPLAVTKRMCQPAVNGQETVFLEALEMTRSWQIIGDVLELLDEQESVVMVMIRRKR